MNTINKGDKVSFVTSRQTGRSYHISKKEGKVLQIDEVKGTCSIEYRKRLYVRNLDAVALVRSAS